MNENPSALDRAQLEERRRIIAAQNDLLRCNLGSGRVFMTRGVQALSRTQKTIMFDALLRYSNFTPANDPYGEHDFGAFLVDKHKIFFKIDAYDQNLEYASPDPCDARVTVRVLTLMLAEEY